MIYNKIYNFNILNNFIIQMRELKKLKKLSDGRLKEIKLKSNDEAKELMKRINEQSKLTPYTECIDLRIKNFEDKLYIREHCFHLYGESQVNKCTKKKEFCSMCCNFHVGSRYFNRRKECNMQCTNLINGKNPNEEDLNEIKAKGKGKGKGKGKLN